MELSYKTLDIKRIRLYLHGGLVYPSVTSVLSVLVDPPYISQWKAKVGQEKADQVINTARARGKYIHAMAEHYFSGKIHQAPLNEEELQMLMTLDGGGNHEISFYSGDHIIPDAIPIDEKIKKFAVAFNIYLATHGANITETLACEVPLSNETIGVAGTPDWIGVADGLITLDDFKTNSSARFSLETKDKYFMQLCIYAAMWNLANPNKKIQRVRLIPFTAARKNGLGEIEELTSVDEMRYYYNKFMECFKTFKTLLFNHPRYAEYAFKLHDSMSISPEEGQPPDAS